MRRQIKDLLAAVLCGAILPALCFCVSESRILKETKIEENLQLKESVQPSASMQLPVVMADDSVRSMDLERYITGVVLAEMPAEFETEALKAQAIVARTYALKRVDSGEKHEQGGVCTDPGCCQAYIAPDAWEGTEELREKVAAAVQDTAGLVLTYQGQLIEATYFSCSGGRTEDAVAVWGSQIPYLRSVESPGEEQASRYVGSVSFSKEDFFTRIGMSAPPDDIRIGHISYTEGGGVETIRICEEEYTGVQLRALLGLNSTCFFITTAGETVTVTTKGFGHRVGMSQYGAEAMAALGNTCAQILMHYYPGTVLTQWENN